MGWLFACLLWWHLLSATWVTVTKQEINMVLLCFLWDLESWKRRALCLGEELSLFAANALNEKEVAHKRASGVKCDTKARYFYFFLMIIKLSTQNCVSCANSSAGTLWCDWSWFLACCYEEDAGNPLLEIFGEQQQSITAFSSRCMFN